MSLLLKKLLHYIIILWNTILYACFLNRSIVVNVYMRQCGFHIKHNNFGDDFNFYLVKALSNKYVFNYNSFLHFPIKNYVCIGSIVEDMTNKKSVIWGGGVMDPEYKNFTSPQKVLATRGPLTRDYLSKNGTQTPPVYGDPALLAPIIYSPKKEKEYEIGIIPHVSELGNKLIIDFVMQQKDVVLIDLKNYKSWKDVIDMICKCRNIASSSLHGCILSDAYGIPNVWMCFNLTTGGGEFKFMDYYNGVQRCYERYDVEEEIDRSIIIDYCRRYKGITFEAQTLLDTCPFIDTRFKKCLQH